MLRMLPLLAACATAGPREGLVAELRQQGIHDEKVLAAVRRVPREEFVPPSLRHLAQLDRALPIGEGQTISQPFVVARMTELLELRPGMRVLEVGTGSGYQAAVLAELGARVHSIEIVPLLARTARDRLNRLGYHVEVRQGDGYRGWPDRAPFDAIVVTAAPEKIPPPLLDQLAPGGRMVIPVGPRSQQHLLLLQRSKDGATTTQRDVPVLFVPMTGEAQRDAQ
jgi:protein-L-isoaspartate(D-aspartate) O-methyltransferase